MEKKKNETMIPEDAVQGVFRGSQKRFGFVTAEGEKEDIYIAEENTMGAMNGDQVLAAVVRPGEKGRRPEGKILRVVTREIRTVVGTYEKTKGGGFLVPDQGKVGTDIYIPRGKERGAVTGHKAVARIKKYGDGIHRPEGEITEILGHVGDPGVDILSIVRAFDLRTDFSARVMAQTEQVPDCVSEAEREGRTDLRHLLTVTIDGEDAKDLDDAVTLSKEGGTYHLGVHIADVSHYVAEGSPLDREALRRGTSVYLVDRVIPMLPHRLSNGICSLNAGEDRLALSCLMEVDEKGTVIGHSIEETVIRVDRRMSYTEVNRILSDSPKDTQCCSAMQDSVGECAVCPSKNTREHSFTQTSDGAGGLCPSGCDDEYGALVPLFHLMNELAGLMREKRKARGALDFDFPESRIVLDTQGHPTDIHPYERNDATKIIEDFMLAANETIAEDFFWQELPFIYRTHEVPAPDRIRKLALFIRNFGYGIKGVKSEIHPKELQKLLVKIQDSPQEALISRLTLRSLKQARYTAECIGHFGLAAQYYCHFTSPIRRYPDLQIHRIIKENLRGALNEERLEHYETLLPEVAKTCSDQERKADEAERETEKVKKVEYMADFVGDVFDGVISGVTAWGIYVELENTVEGLVHVTELLDDYYIFSDQEYEMRGEHTGKTYKLGQRVRVQVKEADLTAKTVWFTMEEESSETSPEGEGE